MSTIFEPTNLLEVALKKAADDPSYRPTFLRELLDSKVLIIPAGERPAVIGGVIPENTKISIAAIDVGGRPFTPFFSSEARIPPGTEYLLLDARALFEITRGAYLVMNPGAPYGKEFFPDEVVRLLDGAIFQPRERFVAQKEMKVLIGQPKEYPDKLVSALSRLYANLPVVQRAWVAFYHNPERDTEGGLLIGLDLSDRREMDRVSGESGIVIESTPKTGKYVDLVLYEKSGVAGYFTDKKPFYRKGFLRGIWTKMRG